MLIPHLLLIAALPVEITVEVADVPDICALKSRVPDSLRRVFPGIRVISAGEAAGVEDAARMRLRVIPKEDGVHLELEQLVRDLPSTADACAATADGIALVVERYLRDLGYEPIAVPVPELETATATSAVTEPVTEPVAEPVAVEPVVVESTELRPSSGGTAAGSTLALDLGLVLRASFAASIGIEPARDDGGRPYFIELGAALGGRLSLGPRSELGLDLALFGLNPFEIARPGRPPIAEISGVFVTVLGAAGLCAGPAGLCFDLYAGLDVLRATATELLERGLGRQSPQTTVDLVLGPGARYDFPKFSGFSLFVEARFLFRPMRTELRVMGAEPAYKLPIFAPTIGMGVSATIF